MTPRRSFFAGAVALLVTAVACGEAADVGLEREEKVLGVLGTFSGAAAESTEAITRGVELAVEEYNDDPEGSFAVRMLKADSKGTGRGAATAAETLAGHDLLVGVVGPFVHGELAAAGPVLDAAQVPFVVPSVSDPALAWSSFRRLIPNDRSAGQAAARAAVARIGEGGVAMFHDNNPQSVASAEGARVELEEAGIKISRIAVLGNPRRAARSLRDSPPAAVLSFGPGDRAGSFFAALAEVEFRGRFVGSGPGPDKAFADAAAGNGAISTSVWADPENPELSRFAEAHRERYREAPAPFAAEAYEGALMILEAIQEVDPNPAEIVAFLRVARVFNGDTKRYRYDRKGELIDPPVWLYHLREGRWESVGRSPGG